MSTRMTDRVLVHHEINGTRFSALEFGAAAAAAAFIAGAAATNQRWIIAGAAAGTMINCAAVAAVAVALLRGGVRGGRLRDLGSREIRGALRRAHPNLLFDTLFLCAATLLPFVLVALVVAERKRIGPLLVDQNRKGTR